MIETPEIPTRAYLVKLHEDSVIQDLADKDFNQFADPGAKRINPALVEADLVRLREASKRCEAFADQRVAHRDKGELKALPTYNDVHSCIDLLNDLYSRYYLLFHACAAWKLFFRSIEATGRQFSGFPG